MHFDPLTGFEYSLARVFAKTVFQFVSLEAKKKQPAVFFNCDRKMASTYTFDKDVIESRSSRYTVHPIILNRRSLRSMNGTSVDDDTLMSLFEAARYNPSHYNVQNHRFVYSKRDSDSWPSFVDALWEPNQAWAKDAAVLMVVLSKKTYVYNGKTIPLPSHSFEAGSAFLSMALEGTGRGLVVHAMGGYDEEKAKAAIGLTDDNYQVEAMVAVGNPTEKTSGETITPRFELEKFISEGKFVEKL